MRLVFDMILLNRYVVCSRCITTKAVCTVGFDNLPEKIVEIVCRVVKFSKKTWFMRSPSFWVAFVSDVASTHEFFDFVYKIYDLHPCLRIGVGVKSYIEPYKPLHIYAYKLIKTLLHFLCGIHSHCHFIC